MRQSRFSDEHRDPVAVVAKRHAVSEQTIYVWRKRFGTIEGKTTCDV